MTKEMAMFLCEGTCTECKFRKNGKCGLADVLPTEIVKKNERKTNVWENINLRPFETLDEPEDKKVSKKLLQNILTNA